MASLPKNTITGEEIKIDTSTVTFKELEEDTDYTVSVRRAEIPEITSPDTTYRMSSFKTSLTMTGLDPNYQYRLSRSNDDKTPWLVPDASGTITFENLTPGVNNYQLLKIDRALPESSTTIQPNYPTNNTANGYTQYRANLDSTKEWRITSPDGNTVYVDWTKGTANNTQTLGAAGTLTKGQDYLLWSRPYVTQSTERTGVSTGAATLRIKTYPGRVYKLAKGTATGTPTCDGVAQGDGWYAPSVEGGVLTFSGMSGGNLTTYILSSKQAGQAASGVLGTTDVTTGDDAAIPTSAAPNPEIVGVTASTVTVKAEYGMEYSIDGGNTWKTPDTVSIDDLPGGTYVFKGWTPTVAEKVTADATYTATWGEDKNGNGIDDATEDHFTVTYTDGVDDEEVFADKVFTEVLTGLDTPSFGDDPSRTGYVFKGWTPTVAEKVTADATYTAVWGEDANNNGIDDATEDHFTVTYTDGVDGEEVFADKVFTEVLTGLDTPSFGDDPSRTG